MTRASIAGKSQQEVDAFASTVTCIPDSEFGFDVFSQDLVLRNMHALVHVAANAFRSAGTSE